jgi:thiol-disulfide isomerase/thioredoxin
VRRRRTVLLGALLLVTACGAAVEERAPYGATDLRTGAAVSVADLAGAPALLVSWTTWCTECDELLSGLADFADSPAAEGVEIVAVNLDAADVEAEIYAKLTEHSIDTALWRDRRNEFKRVFGAIGVPTTVLLDADGGVVATFPGAADFAGEVAEAIADLRGEPSP